MPSCLTRTWITLLSYLLRIGVGPWLNEATLLSLLRIGVGPWLNEAKRAVRQGAPDDSEIAVGSDLSLPPRPAQTTRLGHSPWAEDRLRGGRRLSRGEYRQNHRACTRRRPAFY